MRAQIDAAEIDLLNSLLLPHLLFFQNLLYLEKKAFKKLLRYIEGTADNRVYLKKNGIWDYIIWHYAFLKIMITQEVGCMVLSLQLDFNWIQQEYCNFKPIETISRRKKPPSVWNRLFLKVEWSDSFGPWYPKNWIHYHIYHPE